MATLNLVAIKCVTPSETGNDEVFYTWHADQGTENRYPPGAGTYHAMTRGDKWEILQPFEFTNELAITLWDDDNWPSDDDYLGRVRFTPESGAGVYTVSGNGGQYDLYMA